jgi:hypothetical protein
MCPVAEEDHKTPPAAVAEEETTVVDETTEPAGTETQATPVDDQDGSTRASRAILKR